MEKEEKNIAKGIAVQKLDEKRGNTSDCYR